MCEVYSSIIFCYQCFFDDLLFCCKSCAIDIGLLKTTYLLTNLLTVGFSGSANPMALFPVRSNPGWQPAAILENYSGIARFPCDSTAFLLTIHKTYIALRYVNVF